MYSVFRHVVAFIVNKSKLLSICFYFHKRFGLLCCIVLVKVDLLMFQLWIKDKAWGKRIQQIDCTFPLCDCTLVGHRNDVIKMFKTQVDPRAAGEWVHCRVFNILLRHFYDQ